MKLRLVWSAGEGPRGLFGMDPVNEGFEPGCIDELLQQLSVRGDDYEIVDASGLDRSRLTDLYVDAIQPVMSRRVDGRIRGVFGSRSAGMGPHFGRGVPALIVYDGSRPVDVYPRRLPDGSTATIRSYLEKRLKVG